MVQKKQGSKIVEMNNNFIKQKTMHASMTHYLHLKEVNKKDTKPVYIDKLNVHSLIKQVFNQIFIISLTWSHESCQSMHIDKLKRNIKKLLKYTSRA